MRLSWKKCAAVLLLWSAAAFVFGEGYLSWGLGIGSFRETFPNDSYSRSQAGLSLNAGCYFFPADFPLGLLAQLSFGTFLFTRESIPREAMEARDARFLDIRVTVAPSFRFTLGPKVFLPLSLGPLFVFTSEEGTNSMILPGQSSSVTQSHSYTSLNGGLHADAAFLFLVSSRGFFLKPGISFDYVFLRAEKGEMWMNYRTTHNARHKGVPYRSFYFTVYFTFGWQF